MSLWDDMNKAVGITGITEDKIAYMDSGIPPLNKITSGRFDGGFPSGKMIEIYGESSSGKTLIATNLMIAAQKAGGADRLPDVGQRGPGRGRVQGSDGRERRNQPAQQAGL